MPTPACPGGCRDGAARQVAYRIRTDTAGTRAGRRDATACSSRTPDRRSVRRAGHLAGQGLDRPRRERLVRSGAGRDRAARGRDWSAAWISPYEPERAAGRASGPRTCCAATSCWTARSPRPGCTSRRTASTRSSSTASGRRPRAHARGSRSTAHRSQVQTYDVTDLLSPAGATRSARARPTAGSAARSGSPRAADSAATGSACSRSWTCDPTDGTVRRSAPTRTGAAAPAHIVAADLIDGQREDLRLRRPARPTRLRRRRLVPAAAVATSTRRWSARPRRRCGGSRSSPGRGHPARRRTGRSSTSARTSTAGSG